jgi:hypothetical protein
MSLLGMLKRPALAVVAAAPASRPDRTRLKSAIAARDQAQQAVIDARKTLEHLESIVRLGDDASRAAADAQRKAAEFRREWARGGCNYSETLELKSLEDQAAEASKTAAREAMNADAVRKELARAEDAVRVRESQIGSCELGITAAIGEILIAEARPLLERFERAAADYRTLRAEVICLEELLATPQYEARQAANQRVIDEVMERNRILPWDKERENPRARDFLNRTHHEQDWIEDLTAPWRQRAAQLRADPES